MTAYQAIRRLREDGLVVSWQGRGVFVRSADDGVQPADLRSVVEDLQHRVDTLTSEVRTDIGTQLDDLRRQVGVFQSQLIELYSRVGQPYPYEQRETTEAGGKSKRRRVTGS